LAESVKESKPKGEYVIVIAGKDRDGSVEEEA
jgi:hypothetical protein